MADKAAGERRRHRRVPAHGARAICRQGQCVGAYAVRNLSEGGALLAEGPDLAPGFDVEIWIYPPQCPSLWARARVAHADSEGVGLAFEDLHESETARLRAYLARAQQSAPAGPEYASDRHHAACGADRLVRVTHRDPGRQGLFAA